MPTKLERARDATLEKYNGLLEKAFDDEVQFYRDVDLGRDECAFCQIYFDKRNDEFIGDGCSACPIRQAEGNGCESLMTWGYFAFYNGDAVPAILAAMIYLHGFEEE